jgi:hypothetical protein
MATFFAFPEMFRTHIEDSNLKLPDSFEHYNPEEYPHFHVFMTLHLAQTIDVFTLKDNANVIAAISDTDIKKVTIDQLVKNGLWIECSRNIV